MTPSCAVALSCGSDDGAGPAEGGAGGSSSVAPPNAGQAGMEATRACVPEEERACGSDRCAGVERCIATATGGAVWQQCDVSAAFTDPALLAAVRRQLRISASDPLFELTARQLSTLSASAAGLTSLEGMQCLSGLTRAELFSNAIVDVTPLAPLTQLSELTLQDNDIEDVAPLAGLTQLQALFLHINQLRDIQPLAGLTQLRQLSLDENQLSDITAVSGLTQLEQLFIGTNQLSDLAPVAPLLKLTLLQLTDNAFSDLTPLSGLSALVALEAAGNQVRDVTPLANLALLQSAALERNPLDCAAESLLALRMRLTSFSSDCP